MDKSKILYECVRKLDAEKIKERASQDGEKPLGYVLGFLRDNYRLPKPDGWNVAEAILAYFQVRNEKEVTGGITVRARFALGQKVWLMDENKAVCRTVLKIDTSTQASDGSIITSVSYQVTGCARPVSESLLFESKAALIASL